MRTSIVILTAAAVLVLTTTACSSGSPRPATVRNYGPEASGTYARAPAAPQPQPAAPGAWPGTPAPTGAFRWHNQLASAQADARAQGKLILAMSTKPRCGLCDKFKQQILPQCMGQVDPIAVGFIYNILNPAASQGGQVDRTLRANLVGADLMPLVGFLTPDLRWVHGFYGARSVSQFQGDIAQAQRIYPVSAGVVRTVPEGPTTAMAPVINEYGEPEWSPPGDVWPVDEPEPIDAITGEPGTVDVSQANATLADAAPATLPSTPPQPVAVSRPATPMDTYVGIRPPMPPEPASESFAAVVAPEPDPAVPAPPPPAPAPIAIPAPAAPAPVASAPAPAADSPAPGTWGDTQLQRALEQIRLGRYDAARSTLDQVRTRLPETAHAREASKGCVALYNARRIQSAASGIERTRYLSRARRDLGNSMWGVLFES